MLGFFALAETAITTLWPYKLASLAEQEGEQSPFRLLQKDITRFLTTILIGCTLCTTAATALLTDVTSRVLGTGYVGAMTAALTIFMTLFCEVAPKSIAVQFAEEVSRFVARPIATVALVLYPVGRLCTMLSNALLGSIGIKTKNEPLVSEQELKLVLGGAAKSGALDTEERDMVEDVLELKSTELRWVMTPLVDVVAIEANASLEELRKMWVETTFTRIPVYEDRVDNVVGIVYVMDLLEYTERSEREEKSVSTLLPAHKPWIVPENMSTWNFLKEIRTRNSHMAVVANEWGGVSGIATLENALEEIIGEIYDETDDGPEQRSLISEVSPGRWEIDARLSMDVLREVTGLAFAEGSYDTVSGMFSTTFERIPDEAETALVRVPVQAQDEEESSEQNGEGSSAKKITMRFTVLAAGERSIKSVRIERVNEEEEHEGEQYETKELPERSAAMSAGSDSSER